MAMRQALVGALLTALALAGCTSTSGDGSASVYVKDAPTDEFDEIHVVFTKVEVHASGDGVDAEDAEADADADGNATAGADNATAGSSGGWKALFEDAAGVDIDLLNASGARAAFLGEADLAAGKYTQLRIHVKSAYGVVNGTPVPITVSSGALKLTQPFTVEAGEESRIVIDIDLDRSLRQQGNDAWRMTPVVGSVDVEHVDDESSGAESESPGEIVAIE